ncbi:MAG: D-2-hydroxyacid dehydrogenase [Verrucomicrobia bacterium]|nr:D-2-hydroxyacid dehydrogenase [Verrucomicrobiota bacterium]
MPSPLIVFLDTLTLDRNDLDLEPLKRLGDVIFYPRSTREETRARIAGAEVVLTNKAVVDADILVDACKLRLIAVCATGTNNVDLAAARQKGIAVANVTGYGTQTVAQHALAFILNWATQMHRLVREPMEWTKSPIFTRMDYPVIELSGKSLGLAGTGRIGAEVGRLATAFGMTVRAWARAGAKHPTGGTSDFPRLPLQELFAVSDVISLHCPLTEETRHIINARSLSWMKAGAFLVNTGRGDLVDETALKDALLSGRLGGAGLDVLAEEPPPPDHPLIGLHLPNLMITPHSAWTSREARARLLREAVANIETFLRGEARNRVV